MPILKNHNHKKLKLILLSVILTALGVTLAVFVTQRNSLEKKENNVSDIRSNANISIGKAHQTAIRNGITEWNLEASSVNYMVNKNQAVFQDLFLTFYLKDKSQVYTMCSLSEQLANKLVDRMVSNPKVKIQLHKIAIFLEKVCETELYREAS